MPARAPRPGMGIATQQSVDNKMIYKSYLDSYVDGNHQEINQAISNFFHRDSEINIGHPINKTKGAEGYFEDFFNPLAKAFKGLHRQDYILIGGEYLGTEWVTSTGYFYGQFSNPLLGIPPSGKLEFLRYGEFHRMINGRSVESYCFIGMAELIIHIGLWPLTPNPCYEGLVPGPSTHDGILVEDSDPKKSRLSADLVENMLLELASPNQAWRPFWDDRMVWYGPGGLGSYSTVDGFQEFQVPFENTFKGWGDGQREGITGVGSNCKGGDGDYVFLSGWPQITGIHVKPFLGIEPTGKRVYMRDCDWWRCKYGKIIENWCMLDILHLVLQLERDILEEISSK